MAHWSPQDIPWDRFDPSKVDPEILKLVKAAAMVEKNAGDYATYLCNVFASDDTLCSAAKRWAEEEVQHGDVLGRWAEMADPSFDFASRFQTFQEGFRIPVESESSVRGSRSGELVARCVVEVGTSSYYTGLGEKTEEPVLKAICAEIAADEIRHYRLFHSYLQRYRQVERPSRWTSLRIALGRIVEADDDELAYAFYAANNSGQPYERPFNSAAYCSRAYSVYRPGILHRGVSMTLDAAGFKPDGWLAELMSRIAWRVMGWRRRRLAALAS